MAGRTFHAFRCGSNYSPMHECFLRHFARAPKSLRQPLEKIRCHQRMLPHSLAYHVAGKPMQMHRRKYGH